MLLKEQEREGINLDKNKPKLVIIKKHKLYPDSVFCPTCNSFVGAFINKKEKCINCGQALKYQEDENGQKN